MQINGKGGLKLGDFEMVHIVKWKKKKFSGVKSSNLLFINIYR